MSKCTKVKRPCKICLTTVHTKNGLQCQGACQSWVHYSCLNYTAEKIKDIKNGAIKVTCPCPDCKTILPKEHRTEQPFSCTNQECPTNCPPKCENMRCPINDSENRACPLGSCGTSCKQHSHPLPYAPNVKPHMLPPCTPPSPPRRSPIPSVTCFDMNVTSSDYSPQDKRRPPPPLAVPSMGTVKEMCNTIGLLTNQLNDLMSKMKQY